MRQYLGAIGESTHEVVINRSRFITYIARIEDADDAFAKIEAVRRKHYDATHNCYAFVSDEIGLEHRHSDDGEPSGTAGLPMLGVLQKRGVGKTLAIVTRYFGGIKLGAAGLVKAYAGCVADALDNAPTATFAECALAEIEIGYADASRLERIVREVGVIAAADYDQKVKYSVEIPIDSVKRFDLTLAAANLADMRITYTGSRFSAQANK